MFQKRFAFLAATLTLALTSAAQDLVVMHNNAGKFGYEEKGTKQVVIKPAYDEARPFNAQGIAIVRKGKKLWLIDKRGAFVGAKDGYSMIAPYDGTDLLLVALGGATSNKPIKNRVGISTAGFHGSMAYPIAGAKWGLLQQDGTPVVAPKYQELSNQMEGGMIAFQEKGFFGYLGADGSVKVPALFNCITPYNNQGLAAVRSKKMEWAVLNREGETVLNEAGLSFISQFNSDYWGSPNLMSADTLLAHRELWKEPQRLLPLMTFGPTWLNSEHPYLIAVKNIGKGKNATTDVGVYTLQGEAVLPFGGGLDNALAPSEGIIVATKKSGDMAFYDIAKGTFTDVEKAQYLPFHEGRSLCYDWADGKASNYRLVDNTGAVKSEKYDAVSIEDTRFVVEQNGKKGIIARDGKVVLPAQADDVLYNDGLFRVEMNEKTGYVDADGKTVIPFDYCEGSLFVDGYAMVAKMPKKGGEPRCGVIDKQNKEVVPIKYDNVNILIVNGKLYPFVKTGETFAAYDPATKALHPTEYVELEQDASKSGSALIAKSKAGYYGKVTADGEVIPCVVSSAEQVEQLAEVMKKHNVKRLSPIEAHSYAVRLDSKRNAYRLSDKVNAEHWDF